MWMIINQNQDDYRDTLLCRLSLGLRNLPSAQSRYRGKFNAMLVLDIRNSRIKNFYDIWKVEYQYI
jgi:hypothetical protein